MLHNQSWHCQINYRLTSRDGTLVFLWSDSTISTTTSWDKASAQIATFFIYAWQVARCRNPKHIWFFTKLLSSSNTQGPINIQYRTLMMTSKPSNCQKFTCGLERVFPIYMLSSILALHILDFIYEKNVQVKMNWPFPDEWFSDFLFCAEANQRFILPCWLASFTN